MVFRSAKDFFATFAASSYPMYLFSGVTTEGDDSANSRARGHPPKIVRDLRQADADGAQLPAGLDDAVPRALCLEMITCLGQRQISLVRDQGDHGLGESHRRIDSGANRGSAKRQLSHSR